MKQSKKSESPIADFTNQQMDNIIITNRRLGRTRAWMEQAEKFLLENPGATISWPSSPFPRYAKPTYDGMRINRVVHDYDDPWYVPVEWIIANPEKYAEHLENKRKCLEVRNATSITQRFKTNGLTLILIVSYANRTTMNLFGG